MAVSGGDNGGSLILASSSTEALRVTNSIAAPKKRGSAMQINVKAQAGSSSFLLCAGALGEAGTSAPASAEKSFLVTFTYITSIYMVSRIRWIIPFMQKSRAESGNGHIEAKLKGCLHRMTRPQGPSGFAALSKPCRREPEIKPLSGAGALGFWRRARQTRRWRAARLNERARLAAAARSTPARNNLYSRQEGLAPYWLFTFCAPWCIIFNVVFRFRAGVMELADVTDSKSVGSDTVSVRVRPPAPED